MTAVLNPILTYANNTTHNNYSIFSNEAYHTSLLHLCQATELIQASEFYKPQLKLDICLNDVSYFLMIMQKVRGQAFAWGFYNKVVLQEVANYTDNPKEPVVNIPLHPAL